MGRIVKLKDRPGLYVEWADGRGRWRRKRVHGTRADARRLLKQREADADRARLGLASAPPPEPTLPDILAAWKAHVKPRLRPTTWHTYKADLQQLWTWLETRGNPLEEASDITPGELDHFAAHVLATGRTARTANRIVKVTRSLVRWAYRSGLVARDHLAAWQPLPHNPRRRRALETFELAKLLGASPSHFADCWAFLAGTGLRTGELAALGWDDVDWNGRQVTVRGETSKSRRDRTIPLRDDLLAVLRRQRQRRTEGRYASTELVFANSHGGPWQGGLSRQFKRCALAAGLSEEITPHHLRHTFGSHLLAAGVDIATVQALLGHSSPATTLSVYVHLVGSRQREAVESLALPETESLHRRVAGAEGEAR